jgi:hypothetical protein
VLASVLWYTYMNVYHILVTQNKYNLKHKMSLLIKAWLLQLFYQEIEIFNYEFTHKQEQII